MSRKITNFEESAILNNRSYQLYLERLTELAISMFEWEGLPDTVDSRYMELQLFETGCLVYFNDEEIGDLCLNCITQGRLNVYGYPILRRAYSNYNNYQRLLKENNSVIIYNNMLHTNSILAVKMFARRLYNFDRIIDVNANAQKTPVLIRANEKQRLTMLNLYKKYEGNEPFIFGDTNLDISNMSVLKTDAPYIADKIYELKTQTWNEALTYLGISNVNISKKERLITDEVARNQGGTTASRYSRLTSRQQAADKINKMFNRDISVRYREDVQDEAQQLINEMMKEGSEVENENL